MSIHQRIIRQASSLRNALFRSIDAVSIVSGLWLAIQIDPSGDSRATLVSCLAAIGIFSVTGEFTAIYRNWHAVSIRRELSCSLITWAITLLLLSAVGRFSHYTSELSGSILWLWFAITPVLAMVGRIAVRQSRRWLISRNLYCRGCAIVGVNDLGIQLARNLQSNPELGLRVMGFYDDRPEARTGSLPADLNQRLGNLDEMTQAAKDGRISKIFLTLPMRAESRLKNVLEQLSDTTASVYLVPDFFVFQLLHSRWTDVQGLPVVSIYENPFYGVDGILKRVTDVALASVATLLLALPMLAIAIAVRLSSPGPIFFRQRRYGLDGHEILVWKFRTMRVCENGSDFRQATKEDPRVTKVGAFLRKTSLDELPQLFNVLSGSMSLVGPRPHATAQNETYRTQIQGYMLRHKVKPGITGLAQVSGYRGETETLDKMEGRVHHDHRYIREWTWWLDLQIMLRTFLVVLKQDNAY